MHKVSYDKLSADCPYVTRLIATGGNSDYAKSISCRFCPNSTMDDEHFNKLVLGFLPGGMGFLNGSIVLAERVIVSGIFIISIVASAAS